MEDVFTRKLIVNTSCAALLRARPILRQAAQADAVENLCLLAVAMYPDLPATVK